MNISMNKLFYIKCNIHLLDKIYEYINKISLINYCLIKVFINELYWYYIVQRILVNECQIELGCGSIPIRF